MAYARDLVHGGFSGPDDVVAALTGRYTAGLTERQAAELVDRLWAARVAEQDGWPAETEADRVLAVLDELDTAGILTRNDVTCRDRTEIDAAAAGHRGFAYFHRQDTTTAVRGGGLWLSFGTFGGQPATAVGEEVVAALTAAGLPTRWNGSQDDRIHIAPLAWQLRLE